MNNALEQLRNCLNQEIVLTQEFIVTLELEGTTLTQPSSHDALGETTRLKNHSAQQLAEAADRRHALLASLGYSADKAGLDAAAHDHPILLDSCSRLYEQARLANDMNSANGIMIDTFLAHNQRALDTLRSLAGIGSLYDASGRTRPASKDLKTSIKAG